MTRKVFVSSTSRDLIDHRAAVQSAIIARGLLPIMMEFFSADAEPPVEAVRQKVNESDVFIGIYAHRYGYCPQDSDISITEMEYHWAREAGLDCFLFVLDEAAEFSPEHPIRVHADHDIRLRKFVNRVSEEHMWQKYNEPDNLARKVSFVLEKWEDQQADQQQAENQPDDEGRKQTAGTIPRFAQLTRIVLFGLSVLFIGYVFVTILSAGASVIGLAAVAIGLILTVTSSLSSYTRLTVLSPQTENPPHWSWGIGFQVVILALILFGSPVLLNTLAQDRLDAAFTADTFVEAQSDLDAADVLGANVPSAIFNHLDQLLALSTTLSDSEERRADTLLATALYQAYADRPAIEGFAADLINRARRTASAGQFSQTSLLVDTALVIDPQQTATLLGEFNDLAVTAATSTPPDRATARAYLEIIRTIDSATDTFRTDEQRSISRYNLAYLTELQAEGDLADIEAAIALYDDSIELDDDNIEARYALSSLLLVEFEDDPQRLRQAIEIANRGHDEQIPAHYCAGPQNLDDEETFLFSWHCFALMTTEAGALIALDERLDTAESLITRAIRLAEVNDQFGFGNYTAEAYYYRALLSMPDPDCQILFQIITQRNTRNPRHDDWAIYAYEQIEAQACEVPSS